MPKMTPSEAFVETLVAHGVKNVFGIVGSAYIVARMAEITGRCFDMALAERGPTQLNIPRDYFYGEIDCEIPHPQRVARGPGAEESLDEAAEILSKAKFPVILCGGGVIMSGGI